jgi:hypothetical protein
MKSPSYLVGMSFLILGLRSSSISKTYTRMVLLTTMKEGSGVSLLLNGTNKVEEVVFSTVQLSFISMFTSCVDLN